MTAGCSDRPLRVALLTPGYWPEVRRGTERVVHNIATDLAAAGHDVSILCSHAGPGTEAVEAGVTVRRFRRPPALPPTRWYEDHLGSAPALITALCRGGYDVAHCFSPGYAWAALRARPLGAPPVVHSFHGIATRAYLVHRRYRIEMLRRSCAEAAATTVLSEAAAESFRRYLQFDPIVIGGGVRTADFAAQPRRDPRPTILCSASLGDPRKGAETLFAAFARVREEVGDARLVLARSHDPLMSPEPVEAPPGAEWLDPVDDTALADAYGQAWVSVLAATDEAFGLVLAESMAAGTPVVAARSGAAPELINDDAVGTLFEPGDVEGLAARLLEALEPGGADSSAAACRAKSKQFESAAISARFADLYAEAAAR